MKEADPETELTQTGFRRLVTTGQIESVKVGRKYLVNIDRLQEFLSGGAV